MPKAVQEWTISGFHLVFSTSKLAHSLFVPNRARFKAVQDPKLKQHIPESVRLIEESPLLSRVGWDRFGVLWCLIELVATHTHETTATSCISHLVGQLQPDTLSSPIVVL